MDVTVSTTQDLPTICPCCGQHIKKSKTIPVDALLDIYQSATRGRILRMLVDRYPRSTDIEEIVERIYRGQRKPQTARTSVQVMISVLRDALVPYGWSIPANNIGRGKHGEYRLEPIR